jgi:hypothetical protein
MKANWCVPAAAGLGLALGVCFLCSGDSAAQKKNNGAWQVIVPKDENEELVARALSILQKEIGALNPRKPKDLRTSLKRIRATALSLAALTQSGAAIAKDQKLATLRDIALQLNTTAGKKDINGLKKLAGGLPVQKADPKAKLGPVPLRDAVAEPDNFMTVFRLRMHGGEGLDNDLRSTPDLRLEAGNGIEKKIQSLAEDALKPADLKKQADELVLLAYKTATVAQSALDWGPNIVNAGAKKNQENWLKWAEEMRKHALELAAAAKKGNANAVFAAAGKLDATCARCHKVFK